jgi:hypothetical protein
MTMFSPFKKNSPFSYIELPQIFCSTYHKLIGMLNGLKIKLENVLNIFCNVYVEKRLVWKFNLFTNMFLHTLACLDLESI